MNGGACTLTFGSLFTGIGAFDLGLQRAGLACRWQAEIDRHKVRVLADHFPGIPNHGDATAIDPARLPPVDVICGGDPCPHRSRGNRIHGSDAPDLWPEFLRIVRGVRPLWVLREHVVSGDADRCWADLCRAGYDAIILEMDGAEITGQSRPREYLCGVLGAAGICPGRVFSQPERVGRHPAPDAGAARIARCLTSEPERFDIFDNYLLEPGRGTRILSPVERERLQGLPDGWATRLSDRQRARATGEALITYKAEWIGRQIEKWIPGKIPGIRG